jgi:predicted amidohydrolase YtcJ
MDDETLAEHRLPTRTDLDRAVSDRPVLVHRYCGHVAVANTAALAAAGISAATADPPGGVIDRTAEGTPTGVLRETAIEVVSRALAGTSAVSPNDLVSTLTALASLGITSIGAMLRIGDGPWSSLGNEVELLASVAEHLPLRVHGFVIANSIAELDEGRALLTGRSPRLRWAGLKRFADGSLGGHTAAMIDPFHDAPRERGTMRLSETDRALAAHCLELGGTVAIHAIGDLACRRVIDLFESLGTPPHAGRIEHASVIEPADVHRMAELGVIGCVQPAFLGSESEWLAHRLGSARMSKAYPFASMVREGVTLAAGSDSPVEPPDPWAGMALARDRNGIVEEEALDPGAALDLFTTGAAAALHEARPLATGSPADMIVVDRDPIGSTPDELRTTRVHHVFVGGEEIAIDPSSISWVD